MSKRRRLAKKGASVFLLPNSESISFFWADCSWNHGIVASYGGILLEDSIALVSHDFVIRSDNDLLDLVN